MYRNYIDFSEIKSAENYLDGRLQRERDRSLSRIINLNKTCLWSFINTPAKTIFYNRAPHTYRYTINIRTIN